MLKKEEGGRRDTAKAEKNEKLFFQKYYIFLLILHINREWKICSRYKGRLWVKCSKVTNPAKPESYLVPSRYGKASSRAAKMPHKTGGISAIQNQYEIWGKVLSQFEKLSEDEADPNLPIIQETKRLPSKYETGYIWPVHDALAHMVYPKFQRIYLY